MAGRLTWRRLGVLIRHLPRDCALAVSLQGPDAQWTLEAQLLAAIVDQLHIANWQRTADGQKGRNKPQPIPRPGVDPDDAVRHGDATSADKAREYLTRLAPPPVPQE